MFEIGDKVLIRAVVEAVDGNIVTVRPCGETEDKHDCLNFEACFLEADCDSEDAAREEPAETLAKA